MDLKRIREHNQDDDRKAADGRSCGSGIHADDVALDVVAVGKISSNTSQDIEATGGSNAGKNDARSAEMRVIRNLVQDGEHLLSLEGDSSCGVVYPHFDDMCRRKR